MASFYKKNVKGWTDKPKNFPIIGNKTKATVFIRKIMKIQVLNGKSGVSLISLPGFNISLFHCYSIKSMKFTC